MIKWLKIQNKWLINYPLQLVRGKNKAFIAPFLLYYYIKMKKTYGDLCIGSLDEQFINDLAKAYNIDRYDLDISNALEYGELDSATITNEIIYQLLLEIAYKEIEDQEDRQKVIDSIYCNCIDSGYNIDSEDLESEQAKEFIKNF